ncbi:poly-beta-1,6-N-acetyl-D-glucosamine N-deacetylase PgaB [Neisseria musculi]|uniref:Poly-beta-16-N-acetyl-D-glucosamine N-deacetylase PgaB n=1 Tax=Neisseria musculi TaxID=1815583 RepID=A0A7H1MBV7_9NEIS|nr:poly-beta-1,6-N-acetyl-D-glucosamine N-deacetylase PgaB [Neisseria musculi]QNT59122.1 poly-beta-1,6-N-acetyl-D-glucosamine N-deacetylase PgaB [Neisseria musculi]
MNCKRLFAGLLAGLIMLQAAYAADVRYGVMCYHDVVDETAPVIKTKEEREMKGEIQRRYFPQTITVQRLAAHFNWLRDNGYTPVSFKQIEAARAGRAKLPPKPVLLTFDDGYLSFYTRIYPLLKAFDYPAVFALVTGWMETPQGGLVDYGKQKLPRSAFITWEQVREMQKSGLVEIASHTHDLHRSITGNPAGSQFAAVFPEYENGRYETRDAYRQRVRNDLKRSVDIIAARTGVRPNVIVWPYGHFNETAREIAAEVGLDNDFTLFDETPNTTEQRSIGRALIDNETGYPLMKAYLEGQMFTPPHQRAVHIDLGRLYTPDPAQFARNFDKLIERIYKMGITTVYLQAFADDDGNGVAEAAYFPNRHLKVKADLFSRVAWQLMTRANVKVYAQMPLTAFDLGSGYVSGSRTGKPEAGRPLRLSPDGAENRRAAAEIYEDLAFSSRFNGLVFRDGGDKRGDLIDYSKLLKQTALKYSFNGINGMKTVRSLDGGLPAQSLPAFAAAYDYTAFTALPYLENGQPLSPKEAARRLVGLVAGVKRSGVPLDKTVFELQTADPRTGQPAGGKELAGWMSLLKKEGVKNLAYYPDDFLQDRPPLKTIKPVFSVQR